MHNTLKNIQLYGCAVPIPGERSSLPPDDSPPWNCLSEVLPGLFLTCAKEAEKTRCLLEMGVCLCINLCCAANVPKYRVYEPASPGLHSFRTFTSAPSFLMELDTYSSAVYPSSIDKRQIFFLNIPAIDATTYDIDQHFWECCVVMETVLRYTRQQYAGSDSCYNSILVHCMVGVSRSASVVIAYVMKKYDMTRDEAIAFLRRTRPVIQPNPGFQQQLSLWESLRFLRVTGEESAQLVAQELAERKSLIKMAEHLLPIILRSAKCMSERHYFGFFIKRCSVANDELHALYRFIRSTVTADIDSEAYADAPNYFGYLAEILHSISFFAPKMLSFAKESEETMLWSDVLYARVLKDISRSGYVKESYDTARAFCSLLEAMFVRDLSLEQDKRPHPIALQQLGFPPSMRVSFPFLMFMAPYAEGFTHFSDLDDAVKEYPLNPSVDGGISSDAAVKLHARLAHLFLSSFFSTASGIVETASVAGASAGVKSTPHDEGRLGYLNEDVEVRVFSLLRSQILQETAVGELSPDDLLLIEMPSESWGALLFARKVIGAVVATRLILEAATQFIRQAYGTPSLFEGGADPAEATLPLSIVHEAVRLVERVLATNCDIKTDLALYVRKEIMVLSDAQVLLAHGIFDNLLSNRPEGHGC